MKFGRFVLSIFVGIMFQPATVSAEGDISKGKALYATCQACHGMNAEGNQSTNAPRLAGLQEWYLVRQIGNFRSGMRGAKSEDVYGQQMAAMAKVLPDDQAIQNVAAYIHTLDAPPSPRTETSGDPKRGEKVFRDGVCIRCHGTRLQGLDTGTMMDPRAPRLSGQDDWYLIRQLHNYKAGIRGTHKDDREGLNMRMVAVTRNWSDQDIADVVAYMKTIE